MKSGPDSNDAARLYNIARDLREDKNMSQSGVERCDELLNDLLAWMERLRASLPNEPNSLWQQGKSSRNAAKTQTSEALGSATERVKAALTSVSATCYGSPKSRP